MRRSAGLTSTSIDSSTSGYTNTLAKDVCRLALASNGLLRTRRCTPVSARRLAPDLLERRLVGVGARHVEQLFRVGEAAADAAERADHGLERLFFLAERLRALRVVPQLRVF